MSTGDQRRTMRECRLVLQDDLYARVKSEDPDTQITWRSPGGIKVVLGYGKRGITAHVERADGSLLAATSGASPEWLDEVLP